MKIVILADIWTEALGGAIGVAYHHAVGLTRRGHAVTVVTAREPVQTPDGVAVRVVRAHIPPRYSAYLGLRNPTAVKHVGRILQQVQPDVVHAHNLYQALSYRSLVAAQRYSPQVLLTTHDVMSFAYAKLTHYIHPRRRDGPERPNYRTPWWVNLTTARKRFNPFRNRIIRRRLRAVTKVLAVSQALADALQDNGITNIAVLRNGMPLERWHAPLPFAVEQFRQQHGLAGRSVVLFSGRLSAAKGIHQLLQALVTVVRQVPSALLVIAGQTEGRARAYQHLPAKYGVADHVRFVGALPASDMVLAYHACDAVVVPSVCFDSFPSVNLEAMAASKPVVATCFGGSREAVEEGATGFIVNPYDTETLADRLIRLLTDRELAVRLGRAGRQRVETEFSFDHWLDQLEAWYRRPAAG